MTRIMGFAPVSGMNGYMEQVVAYTHGRGRLSLMPSGYRECREQQEIVEKLGYDPASDLENTSDSVFCAHGAGFNVPWDKVKEYMHLESCLAVRKQPEISRRRFVSIDQKELEAIMEREFGPIRRPQYSSAVVNAAPEGVTGVPNRRGYVIVDGYNFIFACDELKELAADRLDLARSRLTDMLSSYAGFTGNELVVVFDGYRTPGNPGSRVKHHNINVAYTADGETADAYIEKIVNEIGRNYNVRVITSDNLIRLSALRSGVLRTSSKEFEGEVEWVLSQIETVLKKTNENAHTTKLKDGKQ